MGLVARWACGVVGGLCLAFGLGVLSFTGMLSTFTLFDTPPANAGQRLARLANVWGVGLSLFSLTWLLVGALLAVKAVAGPRTFWSGSGRHLLWAAGVTTALAFLPCAAFVLNPALDPTTPETGPTRTP